MKKLTLYPAIDLKEGNCVRLTQGRMESATIYNSNPAEQAKAFEEAGFEWLHIVDLDGAFSGKSENADAVEAILGATSLKTQLGGGIRSMTDVDAWFERGVSRLILGTAAVRDPDFVRAAAGAFPDRIVIGVDARDGLVKTDGWDGDTGQSALEVVKTYENQGVAAVIYTDISRDGALTGVNVDATAALASVTAIPVIASGGVASSKDISALAASPSPIEGVVIGRALYDGRLSVDEAIAAATGRNSP